MLHLLFDQGGLYIFIFFAPELTDIHYELADHPNGKKAYHYPEYDIPDRFDHFYRRFCDINDFELHQLLGQSCSPVNKTCNDRYRIKPPYVDTLHDLCRQRADLDADQRAEKHA